MAVRVRGFLAALAALGCLLTACREPVVLLDDPVVFEIVDGDTVELDFGDRIETVRLLGIDTPESVDPNRPVQCFGPEATERLTSLAPRGTAVRVERDAEARDQYGRLLAYLFRTSDGLFINEVLLRDGFADLSIYQPNTAYRDLLQDALADARTAETGLWSACGGPDVPLDPP